MNLKVISFQVADSIDVKRFRAAFAANIHYADTDELSYRMEEYKYLYIFKYGIVSFLGCNEIATTAFLQMIKPYCKNFFEQWLGDEFDMETDTPSIKYGYNEIEIPKPGIVIILPIIVVVINLPVEKIFM